MSDTTRAAAPSHSDGRVGQQRAAPFVSLTAKFVVGFTVLFALVFVGVWFWLFSVVTDATLSTIKASLTDTVNGAVAGVNGDEFAALVREGQPNAAGLSDDPRYMK